MNATTANVRAAPGSYALPQHRQRVTIIMNSWAINRKRSAPAASPVAVLGVYWQTKSPVASDCTCFPCQNVIKQEPSMPLSEQFSLSTCPNCSQVEHTGGFHKKLPHWNIFVFDSWSLLSGTDGRKTRDKSKGPPTNEEYLCNPIHAQTLGIVLSHAICTSRCALFLQIYITRRSNWQQTRWSASRTIDKQMCKWRERNMFVADQSLMGLPRRRTHCRSLYIRND
jgi:hypothetical protein